MIHRRCLWAIVLLVLLFVLSNLWWFFQSIDSGISDAYRDQQTSDLDQALSQATDLLSALKPAPMKHEIINRAQQQSGTQAFEKEGCVWAASLGFKFDAEERLIHVARAWNSGEKDPCYP